MSELVDIAGPDLADSYREAVNVEIENFNRTRGRRKELTPLVVDTSTVKYPYQKFGRIFEAGDAPQNVILEVLPRMAQWTVNSLLHRKPRPLKISLDILQCVEKFNGPKYKFRLVVMRSSSLKQQEKRDQMMRQIAIKAGL